MVAYTRYMKTETVTLTVDSSPMGAYVALPETDARVGVIVFQEAFGVNQYIKSVAERFAQEGYLAIAPELFHRTGAGVEVGYTDFESVKPHFGAITTEGLEADAKAAYEWLVAQGMEKIVTVGFCLGVRVSFIANSALPLSAAVSFYGGGIAPALLDRIPQLYAPMLFFWGGKDTHIPIDQWSQIPDAMNKAGKEQITVEMGAADHGFFCNERAAYHAESAELAWPLVLNFIRQKTI